MQEPLAVLRSGCKINLFLLIGEKLANGYHSLESLFLPLSEPYDLLEVHAAPRGSGIAVSFSSRSGGEKMQTEIAPAGSNTLTKAWNAYAKISGFKPDIAVRVAKAVPAGGGLGGGSANGAALLRWLQASAKEHGREPLSEMDLHKAALAVGADVPFFLLNSPALASGVGQKLVPCPVSFPDTHVVLVCPDLAVHTAWGFEALDAKRASLGKLPGNEKKSALSILTSEGQQARNFLAHAAGYGNDFENVVFDKYPELQQLHERLASSGALAARMSGTGSTLFALYDDEKIAARATKSLANDGLNVYMQRLSGVKTGS
ncbi:4-(cytidine 5'-diphospho)-2-C-methyl-D-erythritol kinase [Desulfovibrio sp. OttesenSCG-928-G15]|nr:4-(cytidine 5'-diphospho)-2-C-methyl-D-erythritol kinase [Desulfovibrio sp. OttesenSCG-928-G15]